MVQGDGTVSRLSATEKQRHGGLSMEKEQVLLDHCATDCVLSEAICPDIVVDTLDVGADALMAARSVAGTFYFAFSTSLTGDFGALFVWVGFVCRRPLQAWDGHFGGCVRVGRPRGGRSAELSLQPHGRELVHCRSGGKSDCRVVAGGSRAVNRPGGFMMGQSQREVVCSGG